MRCMTLVSSWNVFAGMATSRVLRAVTAVVVGVTVLLGLSGTPAMAVKNAGWYSASPYSSGSCTSEYQLAVGGDGKPMKAAVCIVKDGAYGVGYIKFNNYSASTAAARATVNIEGLPEAYNYDCDAKTLPAYGYLWCVGTAVLGYSGEQMWNYGQPSVNWRGSSSSSPKINF